jgi:regulator of sigma E protease
MDYIYALLGFVALIILHEAGHFTAAKAVGMRVERFCLFFPPLVVKVRRGETEYGIGAIPLGGYVKITGMSPHEEIPPELLPRAYYNQPVWKRIVVIAAGPAVNIVLAILIVWAILLSSGQPTNIASHRVAAVDRGGAAAQVLHAGDNLVAVDGVPGSVSAIRHAIAGDRCAGAQVDGCRAARPVNLTIRRDGQLRHVSLRPRRETLAIGGGKRETGMFIGIEFGDVVRHPAFLTAGSQSVSKLWSVSKETVSAVARIFEPKERKQLSGVVGTYDYTAQSFHAGASDALSVLAVISLSLGLINLFPFLPLDGGHIFWAVAEKLRGKQIPFAVMERAGVIGFVLILVLFVIGLSNDVTGIAHGTFNVH